MCKHLQKKWTLGPHIENKEVVDFLHAAEASKGLINHSTDDSTRDADCDMNMFDVSEESPGVDQSMLNKEKTKKRKCLTQAKRRSSTVSSSDRSMTSDGEPAKKKSKTKQEPQGATLTTKGFQRHFAKHDYRDYAQVQPSQVDLDNIKATRGGVHNPFPTVLHSMLEQAEEKGFANIVSWQTHGRAFLIHEPKVFVKDVLPKYFKHSKISSFQRQLSLYGFMRLTSDGPDRGAYYHPLFLKGRAFLCNSIQRTRVKGTWVRTSSSPESEPDFYSMDPVVDFKGDGQDEIREDLPISLTSNAEVKSEASGAKPAECSTTFGFQSSAAWGQLRSEVESTTWGAGEENDRIKPLLQEAVFSSSLLSEPFKSETVESRWPPLVQFLDHRSSAPFEYGKATSMEKFHTQPPIDAGLQPPPAFPTKVVLGSEGMMDCCSAGPSTCFETGTTRKAFWPASLLEWSIPPFEETVKIPAPQNPWNMRDDDELASFLTDVAWESEFDTEMMPMPV